VENFSATRVSKKTKQILGWSKPRQGEGHPQAQMHAPKDSENLEASMD
jgi:hypothetical protein